MAFTINQGGSLVINSSGSGGGSGAQGAQGAAGAQGTQGAQGAQGASGGGGGGGITQLTGDVLANGSGSVSATVQFNSGQTNSTQSMWYIKPPSNAGLLGYATSWAGFGKHPAYYDSDFQTVEISGQQVTLIRHGNSAAFAIAQGVSSNDHGHLAYFSQGMQYARHVRVTSGTYQCDPVGGALDYFIEVAIPVGAGAGVTISMPSTPWADISYQRPSNGDSVYLGNAPGRTIRFADVLGTVAAGKEITLSDPSGRTFNGASGPVTISAAGAGGTLILDSTLSNWIVRYDSANPV